MRTVQWYRKPVKAWAGPRIGWLLPVAAGAVAVAWLGRDTIMVPGPIVLLTVMFSAFAGGVSTGLATAAAAACYFVIVLSSPGHFLSYTAENLRRVIVWVMAVPIAGLLVGVLRQQAGRVLEIATENAVLLDRIGARERAIRALRESEHGYRLLLDGAPVGLLWASAGGRIFRANAAAAETFGFLVPDDMHGTNLNDLCVEPLRLGPASGSPAGGDTGTAALRVRRADGTTTSVQTIVRPLRHAVRPVWRDGHPTPDADRAQDGGDGIGDLLVVLIGA
ncbi:MAG TPA: PAS domain S-box protein [bacterium]|nr:PAS domain S-box protein [bacterium]